MSVPTTTDKTDKTVKSRIDALYRRPGRLTLRVMTGPGAGETFVLSKNRVVVGRSRTADVTLEHPSVSAAHFELRVGDDGIEVRDLSSTNGVFVGRLRVYHAVLGAGVVISAGECDIEIVSVDEIDVAVSEEEQLGPIVGSSPAMREMFALIRKIAKTPLDVLVLGETGTGKELVSRTIHALSDRGAGPLVTLDCGTLARTLTEAAIFGYKKGAFTGAEVDTPGYVEKADQGTLFIDELGELPLDLQVRLLRVLDRREVVRLGETQLRTVDMRVVAATNRDLERMVADGSFREDLFFRLSRAKIEVPPLRCRGDDILRIAQSVVNGVAGERKMELSLSESARSAMLSYDWPGNVRELLGVVLVAAHVTASGTIAASDLRLGAPLNVQEMDRLCAMPYKKAHRELDRVYLARALRKARGSVAACSRNIKLSRTTLRRRLETLDLRFVDD